MKKKIWWLAIAGILFSLSAAEAQHLPAPQPENDTTTVDSDLRRAIPGLKYIRQPGLANAASKIYSADQRFTISGFGEVNYVNYRGPKNTGAEDLELYYTNLYRSGTYFGYKISPRLIFNSELQLEYLHDGFNEGHFEMNLELMLDILVNDYFNVRVGNYPIPLGYVNINEEPIAFFSVNRPEVERVIIPTQWLDMGIMFYGNLANRLEYNLGLTKGLNAVDFTEGTWIRQGRFHRLGIPRSWAVNGKLEYRTGDNFALGVSGYTGDAGNGAFTATQQRLNAPLTLFSSFANYNFGKLSLFGLVSRGWLGNTDQLFQLNNRVIGSETFGYYTEMRYNILPHFRAGTSWEVPLFVRYERLNTHARVSPELEGLPRDQNDLSILSVGFNVRPQRNIVFKANYQFRNNRYAESLVPESNRFEVGFGFIY
jgi:hypothetical protein